MIADLKPSPAYKTMSLNRCGCLTMNVEKSLGIRNIADIADGMLE